MNAKVRPIRYFSPSGEGMPNGCHYQRGGFLIECAKNARSFATAGIGGGEGTPVGTRGCILVFAVSACQEPETGKFFAGHAFNGTYRDPVTGEEFGAGSTTLEVGRLSSRELRQLAALMAKSLSLRAVLVKDLNDDRFYLVGD